MSKIITLIWYDMHPFPSEHDMLTDREGADSMRV